MSEQPKEPFVRSGMASRCVPLIDLNEKNLDVSISLGWKRAMEQLTQFLFYEIERGIVPPLAHIDFGYHRDNLDLIVHMNFTYLSEDQLQSLTTEQSVRLKG